MTNGGARFGSHSQPSWLSGAAVAVAGTALLLRPELLESHGGYVLLVMAGLVVAGDLLRTRSHPYSAPAPSPVAPTPPPAVADPLPPPPTPVVILAPAPLASADSVELPRPAPADPLPLPEELQRRENSIRYDALIETVGDGVAFLDESGHFVAMNPVLEGMLRLRGGELQGRNWREFWPTHDLSDVATVVDLPIPGRRAAVRLLSVDPASGCSWLMLARDIVEPSRDTPGSSAAIARDDIAHRHTEVEFQRFFEYIHVFTLRMDSESRVLSANALWEQLGFGPDEILGTPISKLIHPAFREEAAAGLAKLRAGAHFHRQPLQLLTKSGEPRRVEGVFGSITDGTSPNQSFALFNDLQDTVRFEAELSRSEHRYRHLVESIADGVLLLNDDDVVQFANKAALGIFGVKDLTGRSMRDFQAPDQTTYLRPYRDGIRDGSERRFELEIVQPGGDRRHLTVLATPQFDNRFRLSGMLLMMRDETARHNAEMDLIKNMAFKAAVEEIADSINGNLELRQLMTSACEALVKYCDATFACALFQEGLEGELTEAISAQSGSGEAPQDLRDFLMHHGRLELVLQTGERQVVTRHRLATSFGQRASLPDWATSFVASPVVLRGKILAVLYAFTTGAEGFTRDAQMRLEQMSAQTASTLSGILLFGEVNARNERLEHALEQLRQLKEQKERYYNFLLDSVGGPLGQIGDLALHIQGVDKLEAGVQAELSSILGTAAEMRRNLEDFIVTEAPGGRTTVAGAPSGPADSLFDLLREAVEKVRPNYPSRLYAIVPPPPDARAALALPPGTEVRESFTMVLEGLVDLGFCVGATPVVMEAGALGAEAHVSIETSYSEDGSAPDFEERVAQARRLLAPLGGRLSLEWGRDGSLRMTVTARLVRTTPVAR